MQRTVPSFLPKYGGKDRLKKNVNKKITMEFLIGQETYAIMSCSIRDMCDIYV